MRRLLSPLGFVEFKMGRLRGGRDSGDGALQASQSVSKKTTNNRNIPSEET